MHETMRVPSLLQGECTKGNRIKRGACMICSPRRKHLKITEFLKAAEFGELGDGTGDRDGVKAEEVSETEVASVLFILTPAHWSPLAIQAALRSSPDP